MEDNDTEIRKNTEFSMDSAQNVQNEQAVLDEYDVIDDEHVNKIQNDLPVTAPDNRANENPKKKDQQISSRNRLSSSERSSSSADAQSVVVNYPRVNCKEKIVCLLVLYY